MTKYWIRDQEQTPQGLPLRRLLDRVRQVCGPVGEYSIRKCRGYGAAVRRWEELLDDRDEIRVPASELEQLVLVADEWFYDLEAHLVTNSVAVTFGVHDSTALFVEASDPVASRILEGFVDAHQADGRRGG